MSSDVALKDRDCIFPCKDNKVSSSPTEKKDKHGKKKSVSGSCQTDIDQLEMEELVRNVARLKIEKKVLRNEVISAAFLQSFIVVRPFSFPFHPQLLECMSLASRKFCSSGTFILTNEEL